MRVLITLLVAVFFVPSAWGAKRRIFRIEIEKHDSVPAKRKLLPNRYHVAFNEGLKQWIVSKTDGRGKLADPPEALAVGSVVRGVELGAKDPDKHFIFSPSGDFERTENDLYADAAVLSSEPRMKSFAVLPEELIELKILEAKE